MRTSRRFVHIIFDRALKRHHRERAALDPGHEQYNYLRDEVASRLVERLDDIDASYAFPRAVDIGAGTGHVRRALARGEYGVESLLELDGAAAMLASSAADASSAEPRPEFALAQQQMDEEELELEPESCDLIVSSMALQWVNDPPRFLKRVRRALKPNGLFLGAMLGGETLTEMRSAFVLADLERAGGVAQRMSPLASVTDAGALLQASGFALPMVDTEIITITYPDAWTLWHHLRAAGDSQATAQRSAVTQSSLLAAASAYRECYGDADGNIQASFQVIYFIGWSPHESQQVPLQRGTASASLKDLGLDKLDKGGADPNWKPPE